MALRRLSPVPDADPGFPPGFFDRADETTDARFYDLPRLVTHIDDDAIAAVGGLYDELQSMATSSTSWPPGCRTSGGRRGTSACSG